MRAEWQSRQRCDLRRSALCELRVRIQSRTYRGPSDSKLVEAVERRLQADNIACKQARPAAHLLTERERRCILEVCTPDLDDIFKLLRLRCDGVVQTLHCRSDLLLHDRCRGNIHRSGKCVV